MKLIHFTTHAMNAANALEFGGSMYDKDVRDFAMLLHTYAKDGVTVEQYHYVEAGTIIGDDGLIANTSDTLSLNDGHSVEEDLTYLYNTANDQQYATAVFYDNEVLTVLYFAT